MSFFCRASQPKGVARALQDVLGVQGQSEHAVVPEAFTEALFGGELSSRVVCRECSHETVALEPFYDLSLPIPASLPALAE